MLRARLFAGYVALALLTACGGDVGRAMGLAAQAQQELDAGQVSQARQTITAAIKERDDVPDLQLLRGRIELAGDRFGPAFEAFAAALALDARNLEALQGVAQLGLRTGHMADSEDAADRILVLQPDQPDALLVKGLLALVRTRPEETIKLAERILSISPGNEGGAILKARALYMEGDLSGARTFIERLKTANPNAEGLVRTRLELSREAGEAPGMLAEFAVLGRLRPKDLDLRLDEANLRYKSGDAPGARSLLQSSLLTLKPDTLQTAQIAALWREYDHDPLDQRNLRMLSASDNEAARTEVGRYYLETGRAGVARDILIGARSLAARSLAARALISAGPAEVGAASAESILAQDKTQCDALLARAAMASQSGRWSDAVVAAQTAAAECPHNIEAPLVLARAYDGRRDTPGAHRAFTDGIARNPQDPRLSGAFAAWLEASGEPRQALAEARRLTRRAPALVSGWLAYRSACERQDDTSCTGEANEGLARARARFAIDLPTGTLPARGLFGRLTR